MSRAAIATVPPLVVDEITLDGKRVQVQSIDLPLDQVTLDPRNPRIANTVSISISDEGEALQRKLEALLWEDDDVRDLYRQVLINQGLVERIIVRQDGKVVEGNCRTVVYRKLHEKQPAKPFYTETSTKSSRRSHGGATFPPVYYRLTLATATLQFFSAKCMLRV